MIDYLNYSVSVVNSVATVTRGEHSWPIGKITKKGKLRLWSTKTSLFLDDEDTARIARRGEGPVGSFTVRVINSKDSATLHVYTAEFYGPIIATWSKEHNSLRFQPPAHPLFKKDRKGLLELVTHSRDSGLFSPSEALTTGSIFDRSE